MNQIRKIGEGAHQRKREPIARRLGDTHLILHVVRQMRKRIALLQTTLGSDLFIAAGERNRLEGKEGNLLRIVHREADDRSHLIVIDAVNQRGDQNDLDACFVQVVDCAQLHVEEIADLTVAVGVVADAVELQIDVTQTRFGSLAANSLLLANSIPLVAACTLL